MSWAAEEWKDGLPQKALVKINQIESQLEKFKKERDQKQFQLESLEQALEIQKRKGGNEKSEIGALKRENQSLTETCQLLEKAKEKLASDLLLKEKKVTSLEQKVTELNGQQGSDKNNSSASYQQETGSQEQSQIITSLEQEIAELRKHLKEGDETNHAARRGAGDESSCTKSLRHPSEADELRKSQQDLQALRSLMAEVEMRNKKLIQECDCARHNAEAARQHLESRMKENEKELKRELAQALETTKNAERVLLESKAKWQQEINAAQAEHGRFQGLIDRLEADKATLMRNQDDVSKKMAAADAVIKSSLADVADVEKKRSALEGEKQKLASELSQKDQEIQAKCTEIMKLKNDVGLKEQANDSLKGQLMDRTLEREIIQGEADKMSQKCLQAENQLMDLQKQKLKADDHLKEVSMSLNQLQNDKEKLEKSNADLTKQLEKVHGEVQVLSASLRNTQAQMAEADSNFRESQHKWKDLESTLRCEVDQSLSSLTQMTDVKTHLEKQLLAKDGELVELLNQFRASQEKLTSKDSELTQKDQSITELEKQLQTLQDQHDSLQKENHQQQMLSLEKMAHAEESLKNKTEELEMVATKYSQEKVMFEAEIEQLMCQKKMIELDINSSRAECEKSKDLIVSLNGEVETLKSELESKATILLEADSVIKNQQRELQEKTEETAALSSEISQRDQHIHSMKDRFTAVEKELEKCQNELQLIVEKCDKLESEKALFISEIAECKRQIGCSVELDELHQKQMTELQQQFEVLQSECLSLSSQANLDEEKRAHLEKEVNSLHNKCSELEARISDYKTELEEKAAATSQLEERCMQLTSMLDGEKAENSINMNKISTLDIQLSESNKLHKKIVGEMSEKLSDAIKCSEELKGLLEHKENRVAELEKEITRLKNGISDLEMLRTSLKDELEQKAALIVILEEKCALLSVELAGAELKITEQGQLLSAHVENLNQLQCRVRQLEEEKETLELSLNKELHILQQQVLQQTENLHQKDIRILALEDYQEEMSTKLTETLREASESDNKHVLETEKLKSQLEMQEMDVEDMDRLTQDLKEKILNLTSVLENMTQERNSLQQTSQSMRVELDGLKSALETEKSYQDQLKHELGDLKEKSSNLEVTLASIQADLEEKSAILTEKDASLENAQKITLEYERQLKECEVERDELVTQINCLQQAVSTGVESDASKTQEIKRLSESCTLLSDNLETVTEQLSQQKMEINVKNQSFQTMELKLQELEQDSLEYQGKTQKELEDLRMKVVQREETLAQMETTRENLKISTADLSRKLLEVEHFKLEDSAQHEQEIAALKSKLELLEMDVEDKDAIMQELNTKISNLQNQVEVMAQEKVMMTEAAGTFESDLLGLKSDLAEEREKVAHAKMSEETLNERINNLMSALSDARSECEEKEKCLYNLQSECERINKINSEYEHQSTQLRDEREQFVARTEDLQACLDLERQTVQARTSDLDASTQRCAEMSESLINLKEELASKIESLAQMGDKLKLQESELTELRDASSKDLDQLQQNLNERDVQLSESSSRIEYLENQTEDLEVKLKDALSTKSEDGAQHEQEIAALKSKLELLEMDVEDKDAIMQELNTKISNLQSQVEVMAQEKVMMTEAAGTFESDLLGLKSDLAEEREKVAHAKMSEETLNERIKSLASALSDARCECEEKERYLHNLQSECEKIKSEYEHQSTQLKDEKEQFVARTEDLQACLDLERQTVQVRTSELDASTQLCAEISENLINLREALAQHQEELASKTESLAQMGDKLKLQESELTELRDASSKDLDQLQQNLNERDVQLSKSSSRIEYLENQTEDLEVKLKDALSTKSEDGAQHEQEIAALKSKLELLEMDVEDKDAIMQELNTKISNLQSQVEVMAQEKVMMTEAAGTFESDLLGLKSDLAEEREKVAHAKMSEETLNERIKSLASALSDARCECEEKERYLHNLQSECEKIKSEYEHQSTQLKDEKEQFVARTEDLQACLDLERQTVQVRTSELDASTQLCAEISENLINLREALAQHQEELASKTESLAQMGDKLKLQESELTELRDASSKDLDQLQQNLNERDVQLSKSSSRIEYLENQTEDLEVKLKDALSTKSEDVAQHEQEIAALKSKLELLEMDVEDKDAIMQELNTKISNFQSQVEVMAQEKVMMTEAAGTFECDLAEEREKVAHAKMSEETLNERIKSLASALSDARCECEEKERCLENLQLECDNFRDTIIKYEESINELQNDKHNLTETINSLQRISSFQGTPPGGNILDGEPCNLKDSSDLDELRNIEQKSDIIDALTNETMNLTQPLCSTNEECDKVKDTKDLLASQNSQLQESHEIIREEPATERLQKTVADLQSQISEMVATLESKEQHILKIEHGLKEALDISEGLKLSINQKLDQITILETAVKHLEQQQELFSSEKMDLDKCSSRDMETMCQQISTMQENLASKSNDLILSEVENDDFTRSTSQLNLKLADLQAEKTAALEQLDEVRKLLTEAKSDIHKMEDTNYILREELDDALNESDVLKMDKGDWQIKEEKYKQDINDLEVKLADLNAEIESTRESFEFLSDQRFEAQSKLHNVMLEKKDLENKFMDVTAELAEARRLCESHQSLEVELESLKQNVIAKDDETSSLKTQLDEMLASSEKSELLELEVLRKQKEELEKDLNEVKKRNNDLEKDLNEVKNRKNDLENDLNEVKNRKNEVENRNSDLEKDLNEVKNRNNDLEKDLNEVETRNNDLEKQLYEFTAVTTEMKEQLAQLQDLIQALNNAVDYKKKEIVQRVNEISERNDEISQLKAVIDMKEKANMEMSKQITNIQKENNSTVGTLQDAIESLNCELLDAEKEKTSLISENGLLKTENMELSEKIKTAMNQVLQLESQQSGQAITNGGLETKLTDLEKVNAEFTIQINSLENDNKELKIQLEEKAKIVSDLSIEAKSLKEQLQKIACENLSLEIETLRVEAGSCLRQLEEKETQLCHSREVEKSLSANVSEMDTKICFLQKDLDSTKEKMVTLQEENEKLILKCEQLDNQSVLLREEVVRESQAADTAKESLDKKVEVLEKVIAEKRELEKMIREYNLVVLERDQLRERVQTLQFVEIDKQKLQEKLDEELNEKSILTKKVQEIEEILACKVNIEKMLEDANEKTAALQEKMKQLESDNSKLDNCMKEISQKITDLTFENASLQQMMKNMKLENSQLEENVKDVVFEKNSLQKMMKKMEFDNCQLEEKIKELDQKIIDLTLEKGSIQELVQKMESDNCQLEEKIKEMETAVSEHGVAKENIEEQKRTLAVKTNELHHVMAEKDQLENKLKELQASQTLALNSQSDNKPELSDEKHKEILRKWEQRCSELNAQLVMDRKKIKRLTEQVEKLKSSKEIENVEDIKTLKEELEEVKEERESYKEKYMTMSQAGERHCTRAKELQQVNEKLNSRNRLLNALLKGEKPKRVETVPSTNIIIPDYKLPKLQQESSTKKSAETIPESSTKKSAETIPESSTKKSAETIPESSTKKSAETIPESSTDSPSRDKVQPTMHVRFDLKSVVTYPNSDIAKVNPPSALKKKINIATTQEQLSSNNGEQNVPAASADVTDTNNLYSGHCSPHFRHRSPKVLSAQKSKIATPTSVSSKLLQSNSNVASQKFNNSSNIVLPTQKPKREIVPPRSKLKEHTVAEQKNIKMVALPSKLTSSPHSSASKYPSHSNEPIKILPSLQTVNSLDQLKTIQSPRPSRLMSLQKRRSTDQSSEMAGGKKSKLSVKETLTETSGEYESKNSSQQRRLAHPVQPKPELLRPMRTRSKKEVSELGENALSTITNSPRKVPETRASRRSKNQTNVAQQSIDEGASECKIN